MPARRKLPASHLKRALTSRSVVGFQRRRLDKNPIHGTVLSFSDDLVLLQKVSENATLDGYVIVRRQQIRAFWHTTEMSDYYSQALRLRKQKPKLPRGLDLTDMASLLMSSARRFKLITIHREYRDPDTCWIGIPEAVERGVVAMRCVRTDATVERETSKAPVRSITMVEFGTDYDESLRLVAAANKTL